MELTAVKVGQRPKVGIGVIVIEDGKILLGKRIGAHGSGTWCAPGGHLEYGESPAECAARELEEETGMVAKDIVPGPWTNDVFAEVGRHYITLFMFVRKFTGEPKVLEPNKCLEWGWFDCERLPQPLFLTIHNVLEQGSLKDLVSRYCLLPN